MAAAGLRSEESEGTIGASQADTPAPRGPEPATTNISSLAAGVVVGLCPDTCRDTFTTWGSLRHNDESNQSNVNITLC